jgi:hypothetical protein
MSGWGWRFDFEKVERFGMLEGGRGGLERELVKELQRVKWWKVRKMSRKHVIGGMVRRMLEGLRGSGGIELW